MKNRFVFSVPGAHLRTVFLFVIVLASAPTHAAFEKEQTEIDALMAKRQYASAASYINDRKDLSKEPRFLRQLSHILVTYYARAINFGVFAMKDLKEGEQLKEVRSAAGTYQMIDGDWEKVLFDAKNANPKSADIDFAIGEYLSRGHECGCGTPQLFVGDKAGDFQYFDRAHKAGIQDYWSLFRLGNHYSSGQSDDLKKAVTFYKKSLELNANHTATFYNLGAVYYWLKDYKTAKVYSEKALGGYGDAGMDADTYNVYARIQIQLGDLIGAEKSFQKALSYQSWHESAVTGLLDIYRKGNRLELYKSRVKNFIALDYSNTHTFNNYVQYVGERGIINADREIARDLAQQTYKGPEEIGAVFFNLGRLAQTDGDNKLALQHYTKSLEALKKRKDPPLGAIEALTKAVSAVQEEGKKR